MTQSTQSGIDEPSEALLRDLSLLGAVCRRAADLELRATCDGKAVTLDAAVAQTRQLIADAKCPAIVGMNTLTIESTRQAVALARSIDAALLPWPLPSDPVTARQPVTQTATLGHVLSSQMILWVGCDDEVRSHPLAQRIAARQPLEAQVAADLITIQKLRDSHRANPDAGPIGQFKRVTAILPAGCDPRIASQWHKLAADLQRQVRLCVFHLPHPRAGNIKGVCEAITWLTGVSPAAAGVRFVAGQTQACSDAATLLKNGAVDLVIEMHDGELDWRDLSLSRISIGPAAQPDSVVAFITPGLTPGVAAQVMRCDG
ncbi:MAG: hypothetical protein WD042_18210, partial [Phycisphaeraceae bacterium]